VLVDKNQEYPLFISFRLPCSWLLASIVKDEGWIFPCQTRLSNSGDEASTRSDLTNRTMVVLPLKKLWTFHPLLLTKHFYSQLKSRMVNFCCDIIEAYYSIHLSIENAFLILCIHSSWSNHNSREY
jgi:hypothetical protein